MMRVIYMGSPEYAKAPLEKLMTSPDHEVIAVVSRPPRPTGRKRKITDPPLAQWAKEHTSVLVWQPKTASCPKFLERTKALSPDIIITAAYGEILIRDLLDLPKFGVLNIHPSLLPRYRGSTPVPAALLKGDPVTGVTIFRCVEAMDAGPIVAQEEVMIEEKETTGGLLGRLFGDVSPPLLIAALDKIKCAGFTPVIQNHAQASYCHKIIKADGLMDFHLDAVTLVRRARAYDPWPGSFGFVAGVRVLMKEVSIATHASATHASTFNTSASARGVIDSLPGDPSPGAFRHNGASPGKLLIAAGQGQYVQVAKLKVEGGARWLSSQEFIETIKQKTKNKSLAHPNTVPNTAPNTAIYPGADISMRFDDVPEVVL